MSIPAEKADKVRTVQRRPWEIPGHEVTPETIFHQRRRLLKAAGLFAVGLAANFAVGCGPAEDAARVGAQESPPGADLMPRSAIVVSLWIAPSRQRFTPPLTIIFTSSAVSKAVFTKMPRNSKPIRGKLK
jgi:hypothetical protein